MGFFWTSVRCSTEPSKVRHIWPRLHSCQHLIRLCFAAYRFKMLIHDDRSEPSWLAALAPCQQAYCAMLGSQAPPMASLRLQSQTCLLRSRVNTFSSRLSCDGLYCAAQVTSIALALCSMLAAAAQIVTTLSAATRHLHLRSPAAVAAYLPSQLSVLTSHSFAFSLLLNPLSSQVHSNETHFSWRTRHTCKERRPHQLKLAKKSHRLGGELWPGKPLTEDSFISCLPSTARAGTKQQS
jgi:hypothetical protein